MFKRLKKHWLDILIFSALVPFLASLPLLLIVGAFGAPEWISLVGVPAIALALCIFMKRVMHLDDSRFRAGMYVSGVLLLALTIIFTIMMIIAQGNTRGTVMTSFCWLLIPFVPSLIPSYLMDAYEIIYFTAFATYAVSFVFCAIIARCRVKRVIIPALCIALCISSCSYLYANRPAVRYGGHGFDYMHGYSSTDFEDYTVYADNSKLVTLDHQPSLVIEAEEDMPVLDGAEACYPLYSAFAKAVYKDIDKIEKGYIGSRYYNEQNGKIVSFSNTIYGFDRLVELDNEYVDKIDMFFGARPSQDQLEHAKECNVELEVTPIGREAFVFFVEEDNPIDGLTSDQIRQIYHGSITNWQELGGAKQSVVAFQRPNNSGSQTMMTYFMQDVTLKEPKQYETVDAMMGVINEVAEYNNEDGAIGYTFRYFLEGLNQEQGVKMLSIDGVYPSVESIEDGSYPVTVDLCLITRKNDPNPNVQRMKDFILSDDGQYIIHETGYGRLN